MKIPATLSVPPTWPEEYYPSLEKAVEHWNGSSGKKLIELRKVDKDFAEENPMQNEISTIHWMKEWSDNKSTQQGLTVVYYKGVQTTEADIKINAKNFSFFTTEPTAEQQIHMQSLLVHELGHFLGLKHSSTMPTVMWPTLPAEIIRDTISTTDLQSLKCEYP